MKNSINFMVCFLVAKLTVFSQDDILSIRVDQASKICTVCKEDLKKAQKNLESFMLKYQQYCLFKDLTGGVTDQSEVSLESQNKFNSLFMSRVMVYNDLMEYPKEGTQKDYVDYLINHFRTGLPKDQVYLGDVYLQKMEYNQEDDQYEFILEVKKRMTKAVNEKHKIINLKSGRIHPLTFQVYASKDLAISSIKINRISGPRIEKKKKDPVHAEFFVSGGLVKSGMSANDLIGTLDASSDLGNLFGGGINIYRTIGSARKNSLILGVKYNILNFQGRLSDGGHSIIGNYGARSMVEFKDDFTLKGYEEKFKISQLEFSIGYNLVLKKSWRNEYGLGLVFKPVYTLGINSNVSADLNFKETVDGKVWCALDGRMDLSNSYESGGFKAYASIQPFYEFDLGRGTKYRLRLSGDFSYALTNWLPEDNQGLDRDDVLGLNNSLGLTSLTVNRTEVISYFNSVKPHYFDLRIGIIYKLVD